MAQILVVDDDIVSQRLLRHILSKFGHMVEVAGNATEALRYAERMLFDMAILDISMPDIDGITLLKRLREKSQYEQTPIIMLTASSQDEDRVEAKAAGASAFTTKPISTAELQRLLDELLYQ